MSVFTTVTPQDLSDFLRQYPLGDVLEFEGIRDGIENTNYFLITTKGHYILTVFEALGFDEVPLCMDFMHYLSRHQVPCADPVASIKGCYVNTLLDKPACIVSKLPGASLENVSLLHVQQLARALAMWHKASMHFPQRNKSRFDRAWRKQAAATIMPNLAPVEAQLLSHEIEFQQRYQFLDLPAGMIHSDLFRDNALFKDEQLTGIIDLYDACEGPFLYDIAVVVNDWCRYPNGALDQQKTTELLTTYHQWRPFNSLERGAWAAILRLAALRFWLSRLEVKFKPRSGQMALQKDPLEFQEILQHSIQEEDLSTDLWLFLD